MTDPIPPGEQAPLRRFPLHAEMTVGNAVVKRTANINRSSVRDHTKRLSTIYWNVRERLLAQSQENLTENLPGGNYSKNGPGIFHEVTRMVEPADTGRSALRVNAGPRAAAARFRTASRQFCRSARQDNTAGTARPSRSFCHWLLRHRAPRRLSPSRRREYRSQRTHRRPR
jgi:hypothetical protein